MDVDGTEMFCSCKESACDISRRRFVKHVESVRIVVDFIAVAVFDNRDDIKTYRSIQLVRSHVGMGGI